MVLERRILPEALVGGLSIAPAQGLRVVKATHVGDRV